MEERNETIPFLSDICPSLVRDLCGKTVNRMSEQSTCRYSSLWLSKYKTVLPREDLETTVPFVYTIKVLSYLKSVLVWTTQFFQERWFRNLKLFCRWFLHRSEFYQQIQMIVIYKTVWKSFTNISKILKILIPSIFWPIWPVC